MTYNKYINSLGGIHLKKNIIYIILLIICFFMGGCGLKQGSNQAVDGPNIQKYQKSESVDFDIYLDGTTSMYGYVNYAGGTVYADAIKSIERTASENWKKENTQYIKFGDDFKKMTRDEFLQMDKISYYDQKDTSLQKVIEQADNKKVNIIVTDLFQTNQDIDSLMIALKNKCLANGMALAIIGMRSQFNGKIFDVGKNLSNFDYASNDNPNSFRPFYLLAMGKENDLRVFVQAYEKHAPANSQIQIVLISPNIGIEDSLETDKVAKNDKKEKGVAPLAEISNLLPDSSIKQYRLKTSEKSSKADVRLFSKQIVGKCPDSYSIKVDKIEKFTVSGDEKQEKSGILDRIFGKKKNTNKGTFEEIKNEDFFTGEVTDIGLKNGSANLALTIKMNPLAIHKKEGKYRVQFSIIPTREQYIASNAVFDKWNFDDSQVGEKPEELVQLGAKTLNITKFVKQLSTMNYELNNPGFHDNYIYFEAI